MSPVTEPPSLRILQIVTQLEPAGAQSMAKWLESALSGLGQVDTVFLYQKSPSDLFPLPALVLQARPRSAADAVRAAQLMLSLRRRSKQDVVVAHTHYAIVIAAILWCFQKRTAVVAVHHWPVRKYPPLCRLMLPILRAVGAIRREIYVSDSIARPSDTVIANPVPTPVPGTTMTSDPDILVVARHSYEKSIETAIRSMGRLPGRRLTLVGGGPLTSELMALASQIGVEQQVEFAGRLSNDVVRALMRSSNAFVLPSLWEAMPVALLEAVAEDCVIIVSSISAHSFLLDQGAAIGFEVGSPDQLASAIRQASDPVVQEKLRAGVERVRKLQSSEVIADRWVQEISEAHAESRQ